MKRLTIVPTLATALLCAASAQAEVSAVLSPNGLVDSLLLQPAAAGAFWSKTTELPLSQALNPSGDLNGDQAPTCSVIALPLDDPMHRRLVADLPGDGPSGTGQESTVRVGAPVVVWATNDGRGWQLVYSTWDYLHTSWTAPLAVTRLVLGLDDVSPRLFLLNGRPYLLWKRTDGVSDQYLLSRGRMGIAGFSYYVDWPEPEVVEPGTVLSDGDEIFQLPEGDPTEILGGATR